MRPYRGKRIDNGEWAYGYLTVAFTASTGYSEKGPSIQWYDEDDMPHHEEVHPETVGQSTGLKDKAGTEGFAGSRIKARHKTSNEEIDDIIVWNEKMFEWGVQMDGWIMSLKTLVDCYDFTIHDNPELITK